MTLLHSFIVCGFTITISIIISTVTANASSIAETESEKNSISCNDVPLEVACDYYEDSNDVLVTWSSDHNCEKASDNITLFWSRQIFGTDDIFIGEALVKNQHEYTLPADKSNEYINYKVCVDSQDSCCELYKDGYGKIENFTVTPISSESINASWNAVDLSWDVEYIYLQWTTLENSSGYALQEYNDTFYVIDELLPCQDYGVSIHIVFKNNSKGDITQQHTKTFPIIPEKPTCRLYATTKTKIVVNVQVNGICGTNYTSINGTGTTLWPPDDPYDPDLSIEVDSAIIENHYITIKQLMPYSLYDINVFPWNDAGVGPNCRVSGETREDAPGSPENVTISKVNAKSLQLEWKIPELINGKIRNYYVTYNEDKGFRETVETKDTTVVITNLEPCSNYEFYVVAETLGGKGSESDGAYGKTIAIDNATPYDLNCVLSEDLDIIVTWEYDGTCEGDISNYTILWLSTVLWSDETNHGDEIVSGKNEFTINKSTTTPYTKYIVCVNTEESCCDVITKEEAPEDPPSIDEVTETSGSSTVLVSPPEIMNGLFIHYKVTFNNIVLEVEDESEIIIESLSSCTTYEGHVSAVTHGGEGPATSVNFTTLAAPTKLSCNTHGKNSISVSWDGSKEDCFEDTYRLMWEGASLWDVSNPVIEPDQKDLKSTKYLIDNLPTFAILYISLLSDPEDDVAYASKVNCTTDEDVPSEVVGLDYKEIDADKDKAVHITWSPPVDIPGHLLGYSCVCVDTETDDIMDYNVTVPELTITDLESSHEYECDVTAKTGAGEGKPSNITISFTSDVWWIVLITIGSIAAVLILGGGGFYLWKRKSRKEKRRKMSESTEEFIHL